jgi:hypothetical protein
MPFALILFTTALGMAGQPFWMACACGVLLATIAVFERGALELPSGSSRHLQFLTLSTTGSLAIAQAVSIGAFVAGRALTGLIA